MTRRSCEPAHWVLASAADSFIRPIRWAPSPSLHSSDACLRQHDRSGQDCPSWACGRSIPFGIPFDKSFEHPFTTDESLRILRASLLIRRSVMYIFSIHSGIRSWRDWHVKIQLHGDPSRQPTSGSRSSVAGTRIWPVTNHDR